MELIANFGLRHNIKITVYSCNKYFLQDISIAKAEVGFFICRLRTRLAETSIPLNKAYLLYFRC